MLNTTSSDIVNTDLEYICSNLREEFAHLSGSKLLITGGAGFLGYYLIQAVLHWNEAEARADGARADVGPHPCGQRPLQHADRSIQLTVYDNYVRGLPDWLVRLRGNRNLALVKHDITQPLPEDMDDFQYIIHAASIASPTYYRMHPIETMDANVNGLRLLLEYCRKQQGQTHRWISVLFQQRDLWRSHSWEHSYA
jgi:UDP-glucuronate decarboxylase